MPRSLNSPWRCPTANHTIWLFRHQHTLDDDALLLGAREIGLHVERVQRELADGTRR